MRTRAAFLALGLLLATALPAMADTVTIAVVDTSRAMGELWQGETRWERLSSHLNSIASNQKTTDRFAVIGFGSERCEATLLLDPVQAAATRLPGVLPGVTSGGDRALVAGIDTAFTMAQESGADNATILVFTSGQDQCGEDVSTLRGKFEQATVPVQLMVYGLEMAADLSMDVTEQVGAVGGTFQTFETSESFHGSLQNFQQQSSQAGLHVLANLPPNVDNDPALDTQPRLEVYAQGTGNLIWQQTFDRSAFVTLPPGEYDVMVRWGGDSRWNRGIRVTGVKPSVSQFDFASGVGNVSVDVTDFFGTPLKGQVRILDPVTEEEISTQDGQSNYGLTLAPGSYIIEAMVGENLQRETIFVEEGETISVPILLEASMGQALLSINNQDADPINGDFIVYQDGEDEAVETFRSTASVRVSLPAGDYQAVARVGEEEQVQNFTISDGEETEVPFELDVALGSIFVELVEEDNGNAILGSIEVFDEQGSQIPHFELENFMDSEFSFNVPVGIYSIRVESDGIVRTVNGVTVRADEETSVTVEFPEGTFGESGEFFDDRDRGRDDGDSDIIE